MAFESEMRYSHLSIRPTLDDQANPKDCLFEGKNLAETLITFLASATSYAWSTKEILFKVSKDASMITVAREGQYYKIIDTTIDDLAGELTRSILPLFQKSSLEFFNRFKKEGERDFKLEFDKVAVAKAIQENLVNWPDIEDKTENLRLFWETHDALLAATASLARMVNDSGVQWFKDVSFNPFLSIDDQVGFMLTINSQRPVKEKKYWFFEYTWTGLEKWCEFCQVLWLYAENFGQHNGLGPHPDRVKLSASGARYLARALELNLTLIYTAKDLRIIKFSPDESHLMNVNYAMFDEVWRVGLTLRILERQRANNSGAMLPFKEAAKFAGRLISESTVAS